MTVPIPTVPPEDPTEPEHGHLERGANEPERPAGAAREAGHQPVAGPGPEPGADVHPGRDPVHEDADEAARPAQQRAVRVRDEPERQVDRRRRSRSRC